MEAFASVPQSIPQLLANLPPDFTLALIVVSFLGLWILVVAGRNVTGR